MIGAGSASLHWPPGAPMTVILTVIVVEGVPVSDDTFAFGDQFGPAQVIHIPRAEGRSGGG